MTSPAWGIPAAPMLASVAVSAMIITWLKSRFMLYACAIKTTATASYSAVPSMFIVAPKGSTNLRVFFETFAFLTQFMVKGNVALLLPVDKAFSKAGPIVLR